MKKRIFSFTLAIAIILSLFVAVPVSANGEDDIVIPSTIEEDPVTTITVGTVVAQAGEDVIVPVSISNNSGIVGMLLEIRYDSKDLELILVKKGNALESLDVTTSKDYSNGCLRVLWDSCGDADTSNGNILLLTFKVKESACLGKSGISAANCYAYDNDLKSFVVRKKNGVIIIGEYLSGDIDENGTVDTRDIITLRRYIAGGYDVKVNPKARDVNQDGSTDSCDIIILRRVVAGGYSGGQDGNEGDELDRSNIVETLKSISEEIALYTDRSKPNFYPVFNYTERDVLIKIKACIDDAVTNHQDEIGANFIKNTYINEILEARGIYDEMVLRGQDSTFIGKLAANFTIYNVIWLADTLGVDLEKYGINPSDYIF